jgi:cell division protein FtsX
MRTDELRAELQQLADEIEPRFVADRAALQRRARRRGPNWVAGLAAVLVLLLGVGGALVVARNNTNAAGDSKKVAPTRLHHIDVVVTPDSQAVQQVLRRSPLVADYARFPAGSSLSLCVRGIGFAVESSTPNSDITQQLQQQLGSAGQVRDISNGDDSDAEIFMKLTATDAEVNELQARLALDRDLAQVRYLDHEAAYEEFKRIFADQPGLIASTLPSQLPESFRIRLQPNVSEQAVINRYQHASGVDNLISRDNTGADVFANTDFQPRKEPEIFMQIDATNHEIDAVREQLASDPNVRSYQFLDQQAAYEKFKQIFKDQPALIASTKPRDLPASFVVTLKDPSLNSTLQTRYADLDQGIDTVILPGGQPPTSAPCNTP